MKYELLSTRHATYLLHVHLVFTPKYRKKIFTKEHLEFMRHIFTILANILMQRLLNLMVNEIMFICCGAPIELLKQYIEQQKTPD